MGMLVTGGGGKGPLGEFQLGHVAAVEDVIRRCRRRHCRADRRENRQHNSVSQGLPRHESTSCVKNAMHHITPRPASRPAAPYLYRPAQAPARVPPEKTRYPILKATDGGKYNAGVRLQFFGWRYSPPIGQQRPRQ